MLRTVPGDNEVFIIVSGLSTKSWVIWSQLTAIVKIKGGIKGYQSYEHWHWYFCCQLTKKRKKKRVINCSSRQGDEDIHTNP